MSLSPLSQTLQVSFTFLYEAAAPPAAEPAASPRLAPRQTLNKSRSFGDYKDQAEARKASRNRRNSVAMQQQAEMQLATRNYGKALSTYARPAAKSASRSMRRALLMPQVSSGSLYRFGKRT